MDKARHLTVPASAATKSVRRKRALVLTTGLVSLVALAFWLAWAKGPLNGKESQASGQFANLDQSLAVVPPPNLLRLVPREVALERNATRPFSRRPDEPAPSFRLGRVKEADFARAIECLAQAIYYEAGGEGVDGERAVAQVVLNRVRHPGFPPSICGTVYQGSDRVTGCQFTFTCDGSLRRLPGGSLWSRARRLAQDALVSGYVFAQVGHATHYHADYVLPYWADSLDKQTKIGRHLFYRLPGRPGTAAAFVQKYSRSEPVQPSPSAVAVAAEAIESVADGQNALADPLDTVAGLITPESRYPPIVPLKADELKGSLITPYPSDTVGDRAPNRAECPAPNPSRKIAPLGANDLRSSSKAKAC